MPSSSPVLCLAVAAAVVLALPLAAGAASPATTARIQSEHSYAGFSLTQLQSVSRETLQILQDLFDVWTARPSSSSEGLWDADVFGPEHDVFAFARTHGHLKAHVLHGDVAGDLKKERVRLQHASVAYNDWFLDYHNTDDIVFFYQNASTVYPRFVTFVPSIGTTWEGRDIPVVHVTSPNGVENKKQVWLEANIHAREWITSASLNYFFNEVVTKYGVEQRYTDLLDTTEFIFVPIVNPDGHAFTWSDDRLWRKNRRFNDPTYGVDLNRNADDHWGGEGSSAVPSSETYRGPYAASEPETQALTAYFAAQPNIVAAVDVHSYGQLVLRPFAWTQTAPADDVVSQYVGDTIRDTIFDIHGKRYTSGLWYDALYPSSGVIMDWWHQQPKVGGTVRPLAYTIELRPTTSIPGFILPPEEIVPTGEELSAGLLFLVEYAVGSPLPFVPYGDRRN